MCSESKQLTLKQSTMSTQPSRADVCSQAKEFCSSSWRESYSGMSSNADQHCAYRVEFRKGGLTALQLPDTPELRLRFLERQGLALLRATYGTGLDPHNSDMLWYLYHGL